MGQRGTTTIYFDDAEPWMWIRSLKYDTRWKNKAAVHPLLTFMTNSRHFDVIIAGAGAAGLSLIWNFLNAEALKGKSVLVADRVLQPVRDKTWCFWDDRHIPFDDLIHHTWSTLEVRVNQNVITQPLQNYRYHCVKSDDYAHKILTLALNAPNVELLEADIDGFAHENGRAIMHTSKGDFTATHIFQSALRPPGFNKLKLDVSLLQHFAGWHIHTEKPVFDPELATFMDFDVPQKNGVTFAYVLPFSKNDALVEYTLFSPEVISDQAYRAGLTDYIEGRLELGTEAYEIGYTEKGVIPMEDRRYPAQYCHNVWNVGTMGGLTKPSTGYTFTRIQQHSAAITASLAAGQPPPKDIMSPYRFRVYDMMLLYNLHRHPEKAITIFEQLFRKNRFDRILQFLEENTRIDQEIRIMASLPWMPFFRAMYRMKHRILTGA